MDHLETFKQIKQSLEQMAAEVVRLSEQIQRIKEQLEAITPPRVDGEQRPVR
jgi:prefoldin subunit 5